MDSGAHGLFNEFVKHNTEKDKYAYYRTEAFKQYLDTYAEFMKKNGTLFTLYANVDVIFNAELTWNSHKYLEKEHGLNILPVIHFGTDLKWLKRYLAKGYEYIALGGIGQGSNIKEYINWADEAFTIICDQPNRQPKVKVHGFAVTTHLLMVRYPWYSVDSTSWLKLAVYGDIVIPRRKNNAWDYSSNYRVVTVSSRPPAGTKPFNINSTNVLDMQTLKYINEKGYKFGKSIIKEVDIDHTLNENERAVTKKTDNANTKLIEVIEEVGLCNDEKIRATFNALYFIDLVNYLPKWPWSFERKTSKNLLL